MKTLTPEEQKRIEQLRLEADWREQGFALERFSPGISQWMQDATGDGWGKVEYRRKPTPQYVPWTADDVEQFRGIWVRSKGSEREQLINGFSGAYGTVHVCEEWVELGRLYKQFEKLDGTPCGKVVSE